MTYVQQLLEIARSLQAPRLSAYHLEQLDGAERNQLVVSMPRPAKVSGRVDLDAFPEAANVRISHKGDFDSYSAMVGPGRVDFAFDDLPSGNYQILLMTLDPVPGQPNGFRSRTLAIVPITVEAGETRQVDLGKRSRVSKEMP